MKTSNRIKAIIGIFITLPMFSIGQDKEVKLALSFKTIDTVKTAQVLATSEGKPVADLSVKLYAERLFGLLPLGEESTDEEGVANFEFPTDLPGNKNLELNILAKVEDDDNFANSEVKSTINWGVHEKISSSQKMERALYASRERAPIYFIITSISIIAGIWGTLLYIIIQLFKIKRLGTINSKTK